MASSPVRIAKLQPWYHAPRPRCEALIGGHKEQCLFSARYTGKPSKDSNQEVYLCKTHADMVEFPVKPITAHRINLR